MIISLIGGTRTSALQSKVVAGDLTWAEGCQCSLCKAPVHELKESNARRKELANLRDSLMRGQLALSKAFDILQLMAAEGLYMALIGVPAMLKLAELQGIALPASDSGSNQINAWAFKPGARVSLHKLCAKPELNGCTGVVVAPLKAGRVGVRLDDKSIRSEPVAVRSENLSIMPS